MPGYPRVAVGLLMCLACIPVLGQDPPAKAKPEVELRWVESKRIEGLTEAKGFQSSCDPKDIAYPHRKPALVLTAAEVSEARLKGYDFGKRGSPTHFMVELHLTKKAREQLAASFEGNETRCLTVLVDGRYWGVHRYEKVQGKLSYPPEVHAETFLPEVGFFSSEAEAQFLVDAFK